MSISGEIVSLKFKQLLQRKRTLALADINSNHNGTRRRLKLSIFIITSMRLVTPLSRFRIWRHRSEIMFGILVVIFRPDDVASQDFRLGQCQISLIVSLRTLKVLWLFAPGIRIPRFWTV